MLRIDQLPPAFIRLARYGQWSSRLKQRAGTKIDPGRPEPFAGLLPSFHRPAGGDHHSLALLCPECQRGFGPAGRNANRLPIHPAAQHHGIAGRGRLQCAADGVEWSLGRAILGARSGAGIDPNGPCLGCPCAEQQTCSEYDKHQAGLHAGTLVPAPGLRGNHTGVEKLVV